MPGLERQPASVEVLEAEQRVHVQHPHGLGIGVLHVHAAHAREHHHRLLRRAVEDDRRVVLLVDLGGLLHVQLVDRVAADVHAEDRGGVLLGLVAVVRQLDAAGLAAAADLDLGLDHHREAEILGRLHGLGHRRGRPAIRHGHAVLREELLALVFEEVHRVGTIPGRTQPPGRGRRTLSKALTWLFLKTSNSSRSTATARSSTGRAGSTTPSRGRRTATASPSTATS